jgi:uncharacterized protein (UPF0303 family)
MAHAVPEYTVEQLEADGRIELDHFSNDDAYELGTTVTGVIREWGVDLSVDIVIDGYLVYRARLGTTGVGNDPWLTGKAAVATHFGEASLLVRLRQEASGVPFTDLDVDHDVLKAFGGSIPLYVAGRLVGTLTTSGEPDAVDHETAREGLRRYLSSRG